MKVIFEKITVAWDVVQNRSESKTAYSILALSSFADSFFIFIPPEVVLTAMAYARPRLWAFFAFFGAVFSAIGSVVGYMIGVFLFDSVGVFILSHMGLMDSFHHAAEIVNQYTFWSLFVIASSPIPTVPFIFAAGFTGASVLVVFVSVFFARLVRYGAVTFIVSKYGMHAVRVAGRIAKEAGYTAVAIFFAVVLLILFFKYKDILFLWL